MNQRYLDYAAYNKWANNRLINDLLLLNESLVSRELVSSFPTIVDTLKHIWLAEMGWLSRLKGNKWNTDLVSQFEGSASELYEAWQKTSAEFLAFVKEDDLEETMTFKFKGEELTVPKREIVQTVFNHGSYHRGQVVMMMRQLGVDIISQTDYVLWLSIKNK